MRRCLIIACLFLAFSSLLVACGSGGGRTGADMANPASVNCINRGGRLEMRKAADGSQTGYCIFPSGVECDEWALMRRECGPEGAAEPTVPPLAEKVASPTPVSREVILKDAGLIVWVPIGWTQAESGAAWTSQAAGGGRLEVKWQAAGSEPEALLPKGAVTKDKTSGPPLSWGQATTYRLQVPAGGGKAESVEKHVLIRTSKMTYDFSAGAATDAALAAIDGLLTGLVDSAVATD